MENENDKRASRAAAKKLGVSLDEYAKQKRLMNTEGA